MKKSVLVTGITGTGKSTVCKELIKLGYEAYDIESIPGLFAMYDKHTGQLLKEDINDDLELTKKGYWICDKEKLKDLIDKQNDDLAFYCGTGTHIYKVMDLFSQVILLQIPDKITRQRLSKRSAGEYGNRPEIQDWIMTWKNEAEEEILAKGAISIDATKVPQEVAKAIIAVRNNFN
ncbi:MAG TPA: AAA family ATPase [Patescibacteria group bacterium]|nr:AAA family ATPase [Patescibacteria group bacterium]